MSIVVGPGIEIGAGVTVSSGSGAAPVTSNLVLSLDAASYSGSGNWLDTSGNSNNAVPVGTPTYEATGGSYFDMSGGSTTGPGGNDAFQVSDAATLDSMSAITIEQWIYIGSFQSAGAPNILFAKRSTTSNGYVGFFTNAGFTFRVGTGSPNQITYSATPTLTAWQQVVVTVSGSGSAIYINGSEVATSGYTGNFANIDTGTALQICDISDAASGIYSLLGRIGIFRIYNTALDGTQVLTNYNAVASRYGL